MTLTIWNFSGILAEIGQNFANVPPSVRSEKAESWRWACQHNTIFSRQTCTLTTNRNKTHTTHTTKPANSRPHTHTEAMKDGSKSQSLYRPLAVIFIGTDTEAPTRDIVCVCIRHVWCFIERAQSHEHILLLARVCLPIRGWPITSVSLAMLTVTPDDDIIIIKPAPYWMTLK